MARWIPEAPVLSGGPPLLMFADDAPLVKQRRIIRLQADIPETRKAIRDAKRIVARSRSATYKTDAIAQLKKARSRLQHIGDELRRLSVGWRRPGMQPGSFFLWQEYNEAAGEDPDCLIQCFGGAHA